ncbi:hypothetical protein QVD17_18003 [Tagetes erecta]|uniref:Uncharacterized protein n=1 Tax=Tagetes erecta TaxID=13708 RepID=A0AAD8NVP5_TARER|nr:hypothetical protein QVD17_18003 [Tagetes erecta]
MACINVVVDGNDDDDDDDGDDDGDDDQWLLRLLDSSVGGVAVGVGVGGEEGDEAVGDGEIGAGNELCGGEEELLEVEGGGWVLMVAVEEEKGQKRKLRFCFHVIIIIHTPHFLSSLSNSPMASSSSFVAIFFIFTLFSAYTAYANGCYSSIISFGDSLADTGNLKQIYSNSNLQSPHFFFPPYGETFFHNVTGRCSNGRLIIDFIGETLGMVHVSPYEKIKTNNMMEIGQGINFAVAGAYALDSSFHEAQGVYNPFTNASLGVQLKWFKQLLSSICATKSDCKNLLHKSLFMVGEIGGNDYNHPIIVGKPFDEIKQYVPLVINTITSTVNDLIDLGAQTLVVPGNLPIGCLAVYLTVLNGFENTQLDNETGCLIQLNEFAEYHNELLQMSLNQIRELHPNVNIIYADYYNAAMQIYRSPYEYGFTSGALTACCGGGGPYNYNLSVQCADPSSMSCDHPETYVNWDGLHLTEAAYHVIYKSLFQGTYTTPQFNALCPLTNIQVGVESSSLIHAF